MLQKTIMRSLLKNMRTAQSPAPLPESPSLVLMGVQENDHRLPIAIPSRQKDETSKFPMGAYRVTGLPHIATKALAGFRPQQQHTKVLSYRHCHASLSIESVLKCK